MVENVEDLLRELKYVAKQYENEKLYTFQVSRKRMAEDCIKGITFLQTENAELKAQIEKMKDCRNCKHYGNYKDDFMCTLVGKKIHCKNKDKWECVE